MPLTGGYADEEGAMDAEEVVPQKVCPSGNGSLVSIATTIRGVNPRLRIATFDIENILYCKRYRLAIANESYCLLALWQVSLNDATEIIISHNEQQEHGKQEDGIEKHLRNTELNGRHLMVNRKDSGMRQMYNEECKRKDEEG